MGRLSGAFFILALALGAVADSCPPRISQCTVENAKHTKKRFCGAEGFPQKQSILSTCDGAEFEDCRDACLQTQGCISFGYSSSTSSCNLYNKRLVKQQYKKHHSGDEGFVFYNHKCFSQTQTASQLVQNSNFGNYTTDTNNDIQPYDWSFDIWNPYDGDTSSGGFEIGPSPGGGTVRGVFHSDAGAAPVSGEFKQTLHRTFGCSTLPQPFNLTAWIGQYGEPSSPDQMGIDVIFDTYQGGVPDFLGSQTFCESDCEPSPGTGEPDVYWQLMTFTGTVQNEDNGGTGQLYPVNPNPVLTIRFMPYGGQDPSLPYYVGDVQFTLG